jgi:hypothetical protein
MLVWRGDHPEVFNVERQPSIHVPEKAGSLLASSPLSRPEPGLACLVEFAIVIVEARNSFDDTAMFEPSTDPILAVLSEVALSRRVA